MGGFRMTMWTLMTSGKMKSGNLCCAILILIWRQQLVNQRGEIGEIRGSPPPPQVKVKCISSCVCVFCLIVLLVLPRPLLSH